MRNLVSILLLLLVPTLVAAAEKPDWAFPVTDKVQPPSQDDGKLKTAPGSSLSLTRAQIEDGYNAPDWYPNAHPSMPQIVAHGNKATSIRACAFCHLPTGAGHDESANLAGLPAAYLIRQMGEYKNGNRKGSGTMVAMGKVITDEEVRVSAEYFASLKPRPWIKVIETDTVPKTYVASGNKRLAHPDGGKEAIGNRIIEIPEDEEIVLNRDPRSGFVAYVPRGSLAKGKELVSTGGGGKTVACAACHGPTLQGSGEIPAISGRQATYVVRQLWNMQNGDRVGDLAAPMKPAVEKLSVDDMLAIAAYTASLAP